MMGGKIGLESTAGKGSTFWFTVSFEKGPAGVRSVLEAGRCFENLKVLIVDDRATNREILEQYVRSWGMLSRSAKDGQTALRLLEAGVDGAPFDLAFVDCVMTGMNGLELAQRVRANPATSDLPLILLSSGSAEADQDRPAIGGPCAFLPKPVRRIELFNQIARFVGAPLAPTASDIASTSEQAHEQQQFNAHVLVAEDNPINQDISQENLWAIGCSVDLADDGKAAVRAFERNAYDLVFMDCQMPEMDGFEATQIIRQKETETGRQGHTPIIALTAHAMEGDRQRCLAAGMDDYMTKPFELSDLSLVLERWLVVATEIENRPGSATTHEVDTPNDVLDSRALDNLRALRRPGRPDPVARVISKYLETTPVTMEALRAALTNGDMPAVMHIAHRFKSSSANLGAIRLAQLLGDLEAKSRKSEEIENVGQTVTELDGEYNDVRIALGNLG